LSRAPNITLIMKAEKSVARHECSIRICILRAN